MTTPAATTVAVDASLVIARMSMRSPGRRSAATSRSTSRTGLATTPAPRPAERPGPSSRRSVMTSPRRTEPVTTRPTTSTPGDKAPSGSCSLVRSAERRSSGPIGKPAGRSRAATRTAVRCSSIAVAGVGVGGATASTRAPAASSAAARHRAFSQCGDRASADRRGVVERNRIQRG